MVLRRASRPRNLRDGKTLARASLLLATLVVGGGVQAQQIFTCKDSQGRVLSSDRPIPECANRPMRELSHSGVVIREIPAPLTPEQLQQRAQQAQQERDAAERVKEERHRDDALMTAYPSITDLERARKRSLAGSEELLKQALGRKQELLNERRQLDKTIAQRPKHAATVNESMRYTEIDDAVRDEDVFAAQRRAEIERTNRKFDDDRERLGRLLGQPAGPVAPAGSSPAPTPATAPTPTSAH